MEHIQPKMAALSRGDIDMRLSVQMENHHRGLALLRRRRTVGELRLETIHRLLRGLLRSEAQVEGIDYHLANPALTLRGPSARQFILVLPPLGNLSNPYFRVHPRRNDRIVAIEPPLKNLFPEVDFALCGFTGHALGLMASTCPERFIEVRRVLIRLWIERLKALLSRLPDRGVLIDLPTPDWMPHPPFHSYDVRRVAIDPHELAVGTELLKAALTSRPY